MLGRVSLGRITKGISRGITMLMDNEAKQKQAMQENITDAMQALGLKDFDVAVDFGEVNIYFTDEPKRKITAIKKAMKDLGLSQIRMSKPGDKMYYGDEWLFIGLMD